MKPNTLKTLNWIGILLALTTPSIVLAQTKISVPATKISAGKTIWVDSEPGEPFELINARVDIGTLKAVKGEQEVQIWWPSAPGTLQMFRQSHPDLAISSTSQFIDRERVICRADGMISYQIESSVRSPDGKLIYRQAYDPITERKKAEATAQRLKTTLSSANSYGNDPRSLACWAAARQCQHKDFTWPPPPNMTPLEHSDRATRMRAAYNQRFIPTCH